MKIYVAANFISTPLAVVWSHVSQNPSLLAKSVIVKLYTAYEYNKVYKYNKTDRFHLREHLELFPIQMRDKQYFQGCFETTSLD